ncbi:glycosyltransferase [Indiicoccus explosivorum]|uniref:glycosyltransferase n=1 Tax=Indiicoccus explosivorum TaxID=1917864 RepID=UPI00158824E9|nr:glycosyltransferase [Indiicoccus explosivorum]
MKVVLASPNADQMRGNTVTVRRIAAGIRELGAETAIISSTEEAALPPGADIVHGFHAFKFAQFLKRQADRPDPFVVTMTGTDLNHDLFDPAKRDTVIGCLEEAAGVHVFNEEARDILLGELPALEPKVTVIGQGATAFPETGADQPEKETGTFLFFLPAGIRKVKNVPTAIRMLRELHDRHPEVRLWLAGPVLEADEGEAVRQLIADNESWIRYFGQLPHEEMGSLYREADVLLNTSISEGQPAAILEAMALGVPVIVSDNQGNRSIVGHGKTGFIYKNPSQFLDYAGRLLNNYKLRQQLGGAAKSFIARHHDPRDEAEAIMSMYRRALGPGR